MFSCPGKPVSDAVELSYRVANEAVGYTFGERKEIFEVARPLDELGGFQRRARAMRR